jgi:signal transduction histidine kinase
MNSNKLARVPPLQPVAVSDIHSLRPGRPPSFESIASIAPLLEDITDRLGGGIVISSGGAEIFRTSGFDPAMMIAEDGIIELELGGRMAYMRFLRQTAAPSPALAKMVLLGQLSFGTVHDINNLLTAISGNIGILEHDGYLADVRYGDRSRDILKEMSKAVSGIAALCRRIQTLGSQKDIVTAVSISDAVNDSLVLLRFFMSSAKDRGLDVSIENRVPDGLWGMAMPAELQSCILNILKNAIEHGFCGKEAGRILLDAIREGGYIRLDIANDGHMIPKTVSETLLRHPLTSECNNGIGLFSASERLRSFGGYLTFSSEPERTVFSISVTEALTRH